MNNSKTFAAAAALAVVFAAPAAFAQISLPLPSPFGPTDEIGAANYLTPSKAREAASLVTRGKVYRLGIVTGPKTPAYPPRSYSMYVVQPGQESGATIGHTKTVYNDDIINTWLGIGSQIDGLGHIGVDYVYYNNAKASDVSDMSGLKKYGVETIPPMVTRGVLLNMAEFFATDIVSEGTAFNTAEIQAAAREQDVTIGRGDVVLFHTGWLSIIESDSNRFASVEPGLGVDGARYLSSLGVVAIGADTWGLEVIPFEKGTGAFEVHQVLLAQNGVYILENMDTAELASDGVSEFMFTLGAARMQGAVQMIINPVAIR